MPDAPARQLGKIQALERSVPIADEIGGELERLFKVSAKTGPDDLVFADPQTGGPVGEGGRTDTYALVVTSGPPSAMPTVVPYNVP